MVIKKKVTLSLDSKVYNDFQKYCEENAIMLSKKVELIMKDMLKNKKRFLSAFFGFFMVIFMVGFISADVLFNDTFEDGDISGWITSGGQGDWHTNDTEAVGIGPPHGSWEMISQDSVGLVVMSERSVDTSGYNNIKFDLYYRGDGNNLDFGEYLRAKWYDGSVWTTVLEITGDISTSYVFDSNSLSSSANNNPNFKIKFECNTNQGTEGCAIDDVNVTGDIFDTDPPDVIINSPLNKTYNSIMTFFNLTATDITLEVDSCFYNLDNGNNISMSNYSSSGWNASNLSMTEGGHIVKYYCNDSNSNLNDTESVSFYIDSINPSVSGLIEYPSSPATYSPGAFYMFNATVIDSSSGSVVLIFNSVNYTPSINGNEYYVLIGNLGAGTYNYRWYANDSSGNINDSENGSFTINKALPNVDLLLNGISNNISLVYLQGLNASATSSGGTVNLFRDGNNINSENSVNAVLGVNYYSYKANVTGNTNYSDSSGISLYANVTKANPSENMQIVITPSQNVDYGTQTTSSATESNSGDTGLIYNLYRDGSGVGNPNVVTLSAGTYIYIYNTTGGANYTAGSVNATLIVNDTTAPSFSGFLENPVNGSSYVNGQLFKFNASVSDDSLDTVGISFNGVNYSGYNYIMNISNVFIFNISNLAAGVYNYYWWANDSNGNFNKSSVRSYSVSKSAALTSLVFDKVSPQTYGTLINVSCFVITGVGSVNLYRDDVLVNSENGLDVLLGAFDYEYECNLSESQNYTSTTNTSVFIINKANGEVSLLLNGVSDNLSIGYPQQVNATASTLYGGVSLYRNGGGIDSENGLNVSLSAGSYNYTAVSSGNQNYSGLSITYFVNINKSTLLGSLTNDKNWSRVYDGSSNIISYSENNSGDSDVVYAIFVNGVNKGGNYVQGGAGNYSIILNATDGVNYSYSSGSLDSDTLVINKTIPIGSISGTTLIVYGSTCDVLGSESNNGDIDLSYVLYRNGVIVSNPDNSILGAGNYSYSYNTTGGANYTISELDTFDLAVNKKNPNSSMSLIITPSQNVNYGTQTSASASETNNGDSDIVYQFFRDGSLVSNPNTETLSAGTYIYVYNTTGGVNYSSGSVIKTLVVNKLSNPVSLKLNGVSDNVTIGYGNNLNASSSSASGLVSLFRNGINVTSENNMNVLLGGGSYEYFVNSTGNLNYLENSSGERFFVNVNKASSVVYLHLNHSRNNVSMSLSDSLAVNCSLISGTGDILVYINESLVYSGSSPYYNLTSFPEAGIYNVTVIYNENQNYSSSSETFFAEVSDNIGPVVLIDYPLSKTYGYNTSLPLNYSITDSSGVSSCWYSLDYEENFSLPGCFNTTFDKEDGNYILTLYSNDSLGNLGYSEVMFSISTNLAVSLSKPSNGAFINKNKNIQLNYTVDTALLLYNCSLYIDSEGIFGLNLTNNSYVNTSGGINSFYINLTDGVYKWNVKCFAGLYNSFAFSNYSFTVDSVFPMLDVFYPLNNSIINRNNSILLNYSVNDSYLKKCWYTLNNGLNNYSLSCGLGFNNITFNYPKGAYNLTIYSNDSSGNIGSYTVYNITINEDKISPLIFISEPNGIKTSISSIPLQFIVSDNVDVLNELMCYYNVSYNAPRGVVSGLENVSIDGCLDTIFDVPIYSSYVLYLSVIDKSGNKNYSNISFSVSAPVSPPPGGGGGGSSSGGGGVSYVPVNKGNSSFVDLDMPKLSDIIGKEGIKKSLSLKIKNTGDVFLNKCRLIMKGDISSWFYSTQINGISPGESVDYLFDINIPDSVSGNNNGELFIICDEINKSQEIIVTIPDGLSTIRIGELKYVDSGLDINYEVDSSLLGEELNVEIWLVDSDGIEYNRINDVFKIESSGAVNRNVFMSLPEDMIGIYNIYFAFFDDLDNHVKQSVVLGKSTATGFSVLNQPKNKMIIYVIFIFVTFVIVFIIMWGKRKNKMKGVKLKKIVKR